MTVAEYLIIYLFIFKILFIFRQRGREGEKLGEKQQCVVASHTPPTGDLAYNPGICHDWELNQQPFSSQSGAQSTEPHQPGHDSIFRNFMTMSCCVFREK